MNKNTTPRFLTIALLLVLGSAISAAAEEPRTGTTQPPLILAHYMPWFAAKPVSQAWGWHWTMNHFDSERTADGKRQIASHFYPLIGPYDSGDTAIIEYHLLTMKLAGIDGVIVDWYGRAIFRDYATLHHNTTLVLQQCERLGMKFVICYEDQTITAMVEGKRIAADQRVAHAADEISWLGKYWFKSGSYVKLDGKPVLLSFGREGLTDDEWSQCLSRTDAKVTYFSQHHRRAAAVGAFDWPQPNEALPAFERFHKDAQGWPQSIPVAFPRFVDIYAEAKVGPSYGRLDDDKGRSFRTMLERALQSKAALVQLATWNDWGEGTQIEPSHEFGYRDLETVRNLRHHQGPARVVATKPEDLRLPAKLLERRRLQPSVEISMELDRVAEMMSKGQCIEAEAMLK
jgi:hypothetical protein